MSIVAIIGAAMALQYYKDFTHGEVSPKPFIGGGIVMLMLVALADGVSKRLAIIMAWIVFLAVAFNSRDAIENIGK